MIEISIGEIPADGHYEGLWDAWNRLSRLLNRDETSPSSSPAKKALNVIYQYDALTRRIKKGMFTDPNYYVPNQLARSTKPKKRQKRLGPPPSTHESIQKTNQNKT